MRNIHAEMSFCHDGSEVSDAEFDEFHDHEIAHLVFSATHSFRNPVGGVNGPSACGGQFVRGY